MGDNRAVAFRKLKPVCVGLSKTALDSRAKGVYGPELSDALERLHQRLLDVGLIDSELASYAFFPLSHVFHGLKALPLPVLNLSLECLRILIIQGWTHSREAPLCKQLLVLISFIVSPTSPDEQSEHSYGDTAVRSALQCLSALFSDGKGFVKSLCDATEEGPLAVFGQTVSAVLTALKEEGDFKVQIAASEGIVDIVNCLSDETLLRNFFPGIVSGLTKFLQPRSGVRKPGKAIAIAVDALQTIILACFKSETAPNGAGDVHQSSSAWRAEQVPQLQKALAQVIKLRDHERAEVLKSLLSLCTKLVIHCRTELGELTQLFVDTSLYLSTSEALYTDMSSKHSLESIFSDEVLVDSLLKSMQEWLTALPRIAQSADDERLTRHLRLIFAAYSLLEQHRGSQIELAKSLVASLEQVVTIALQDSGDSTNGHLELSMQESTNLNIAVAKEASTVFQQIGHTKRGQGRLLKSIQQSIHRFSESSAFQSAMSSRYQSLESSWMAVSLLRDTLSLSHALIQFVESSRLNLNPSIQLAEYLYGQAVEYLTHSMLDDNFDWRQQAIALEVVAVTAQVQKEDFAPELVDVLFPVLERIGSTEVELREHALTCLNILAQSCGMDSAGELIVQNADYLVNSVAQRLHVPDISPHTPRVLAMIIELCGSSLIPYLDDTMTSVFEILDDYHGYYGLVDPLFAVLEAVVNQACQPSSRLVEGPATKHQVQALQVTQIHNVRSVIMDLAERKRKLDSPAVPTTQANEEPSKLPTDAAVAEAVTDEDQKKVAPSQSYSMVESITRHCQHYLTHASPDLRRRLLSLVATASVALSRSEDRYLPLINDIWPVVISRLHDDEPTVVLEAMQTLSALLQNAGSFLLSRMKDAWPDVLKVGKGLRMQADARNKGKGGRGGFSMTIHMVEAFVDLLSYLVASTGMSAEMEDDVLDMLGPYSRHKAVHDLLESINADALWLLELQQHDSQTSIPMSNVPVLAGFQFREIVTSWVGSI